MKVDSLSIHLKTSMISSQTKHESFNSFGSHTQLLIGQFFLSFLMSLSSLIFICIQIFIWKILKLITNTRPEFLEDSSDQTNICQQSCFFSSNPKNSYYFIRRSSISHCINCIKKRGGGEKKIHFLPIFSNFSP